METQSFRRTTVRPSRDDILAGGHLLLMTNSGPLDVLGFIGKNRRFEDLAGAAEVVDSPDFGGVISGQIAARRRETEQEGEDQ